MKYVCLLRGINVGGKNKISMTELKLALANAGFTDVSSYINSGNILLESDKNAHIVARSVEAVITKGFKLDSEPIKVRAISTEELGDIIRKAPEDFGAKPDTYRSDVAFMIDEDPEELMKVTPPNSEVDTAWKGESVVYYQRLNAKLTKSRMGKIVGTPIYKNVTIRNWNTVTKLLNLLETK